MQMFQTAKPFNIVCVQLLALGYIKMIVVIDDAFAFRLQSGTCGIMIAHKDHVKFATHEFHCSDDIISVTRHISAEHIFLAT